MIEVAINYRANEIDKLSVSGHANAGAYGQDLVCAGVSAVMNGAFNAFNQLTPQNVNLVVSDNLLKIEVKTLTTQVKELMSLINIQLATIAHQYPQNIQIKEVH